MDRFGEKLRALRIEKGLTLKGLASRLGYNSHSYISEIESGRKQPSVEFILLVARVFNVTTDELMKDDLQVGLSRPTNE
jgi:transcriptional regulator with XRE-family HTH domain